jgi:hypothetical protein
VSNVNDLETQIQAVLDASVADVMPPSDLIQLVQRRHRRRMARAALATAAAAGAITAAVALTGLPGAPGSGAGHRHTAAAHQAPAFPGGGRLLFAGRRGLKWLYPDGKTVRVAGGFSGAQVSGTELVAWNTRGVYTMGLDGARQHLALTIPVGSGDSIPQAGAVSPGGVRLAYYTGKTLWAANLETGRRTRLGRLGFGGWRNDTTILASADGGRKLLLLNVVTGRKSAYLSAADPALVRAYQHARPHAAAPGGLMSEGFSGPGPSAALAITVAAPGLYGGSRPAEVIMTGTGRLLTYAPPVPRHVQLEFSWGPHGLFRIETGEGDDPASWNAYIGTVKDNRLSAPVTYGAEGAAFNPAGTVIALQDSNQITFLPVPQPACQATACLHFQFKYLVNEGRLITWAP